SVLLQFSLFFFHCPLPLPAPPSFPTRRSSDLRPDRVVTKVERGLQPAFQAALEKRLAEGHLPAGVGRHEVKGEAHLYLKQFPPRSEEHTSELQSRGHLVCRLLLEKKKTRKP